MAELRGPLTPTQRDVYLDQQRHPDLPIYRIGGSVCLGPELDRNRWEEAVRTVFSSEPIMQTHLEESAAGLFQYVEREAQMRMGFDDHVGGDGEALRAWIGRRLREPTGPAPQALFQHWLVRTVAGDFYAAVGAPHMLSDGHTFRVFFERVSRCYEALAAGQPPPGRMGPSFYDYLGEAGACGVDGEEAREFWRARLREVAPLRFRGRLELPGEYRTERLLTSADETEAVTTYCRARGLGVSTFYLALYCVVLQRYREPGGDWVVHAIRGSRPPRFTDTMGCFFRVVPYLLPSERLRRPARLADLFAYLRDYPREPLVQEEISMLRLQECMPAGGCRVVYNFYDFDRARILGRERSLEIYFSHPPSEVQLVVGSREGKLELRHLFHTSQLLGDTILQRIRQLSSQVIGGAERVADLDWLLEHERRQGTRHRERTITPAARPEKTVHELFEEHAARQPEAIALVAGECRWTYGELNGYANRLARVLRGEGVGPGRLVGLYLDRSCEQVAAVLAVLKAGAAYVPIDPEYPEARARLILEDSRVGLLIVDARSGESAPATGLKTLRLDLVVQRLAAEGATNLERRAGSGELAYVIYTSGSTGRPKGVMVTHHNLRRLFQASQEPFDFRATDVWPLLHSYAFDFSVWEIWGALAFGGRLVVVPSGTARSPEELRDLLDREGVTVLNQTPSAFYRFMEEERRPPHERLAALRWIIFGGEALDVARLRPWLDRYGDERPLLVNMYGITETTVHVTWRRLRREDAEPGRPNVIGRPLSDLRVYLTDEEGQLVPKGVAGEIWVGGDGVASGYLNREELTAERFLEDPFDPRPPGRVYRSGDLARELPGGDLEYLGRIDHQVQIRGYRVEPGEIESVLRQHPGVADAAVLAHPDPGGDLTLTAYVTRGEGGDVSEAELRNLLRLRLPAYMACSRFCFLPELPLTSHGKVDRTALPRPGDERPEIAVGYEPPRTQREEILANLFGEVTGLDRVGIHDDFFALGGNSLSAAQVVARVRDLLDVGVPVSAVFEWPTVAALAEAIEAKRFDHDLDAPPVLVRMEGAQDAPLTFAQERVWLIQQLHPEAVAYHFEAEFRFRGKLQVELLERCLDDLVQRHEVLRTTFPVVDGRPVQRVHHEASAALEKVSLEDLPLADARRQVESWRRETGDKPLPLDRLPLIVWTLFRLSADEHILVHREHHLLHDGWSFVVLAGELLQLYRSYLEGVPSPLLPLTLRLGDFARAEREWMRGPAAEKQLAYWKQRLEGCPQALELPCDFARPPRPSYRGDSVRFDLSEDLVRSVRALARENGVTFFVTMLGMFAVLLARYSGERDLCIGSGVANRRRREIEGMVGMMLNNVILRLDLSREVPVTTFLKQAQRVVLEALGNQDVPFDRVVRLARSGGAPVSASAVCPIFFSSYEGPVPQVPIAGLTVDIEAGLANGSAKFDLNVIVVSLPKEGLTAAGGASERAERVTLIWEYSTDLFERETVERMSRHYVSLLRACVDGPQRAWNDLEVASDDESLSLAHAVSRSASYRRDASLVDLWQEQARRSSDDVAVRAVDGVWTYRELDVVSNRLARLLRDRGVTPDDVVGFCLPRGRAAVACMLGILKAGAAYLPLDPRLPERRIAWLAADTRIRSVLTNADSLPRLQACSQLERLSLNDLATELDRQSEAHPASTTHGESLAYVMFTSGSTGPPKGVEVLHRGIVRLLFGVDYVRLGRHVRILQLAPLSFDASTFEIWGALLHGGTLIIHPEDVPDVEALGRIIAQERVNTMWLNASLFNLIVDQQPAVLTPVEQLLIGGEALSVDHVRRAYENLPRTQIINGYGPTENTTFSCCFAIPRDLPLSAHSVPLGRPIAHSSAYILDERLRPLPKGLIGEIYLGGDGVARGYRFRPELTAQHFLSDPFAKEPGARIYRSGDFGRFRSDGTLEFRGRRDDQVKIRGFRIEPAEVEWVLRRVPGIRQVAVVTRQRPSVGTHLVAYVVPEPGMTRDAGRVRSEARRELPPHLVPQEFVFLDALPLSHHGKLDRSALPDPPVVDAPSRRATQPRNAREEIVAGVMAETLGAEDVGTEDEFFDVGGHSLLGLELLERLSRMFGAEIPVRALIENPTAAGLARVIEEMEGQKRPNADHQGAPVSLVRIKPGGSKPPLFFTPGGDGGEGALLVYARLARFLDVERPFYGLRARGINDDAAPHRTVEEMAADYLAEVKRVQPEGPYFFGGECVGGVIAYEMARQALCGGDDVGVVVLLDSRPPRYVTRLRHWLRYLSSRARIRLDHALGPLPAEGRRAPAPGRHGLGANGTKSARRWLDKLLPYDAKEAPPTIQLAWVEYQRTLLRYRPRPLPGRMALLLSEQYAAKGVGQEWEQLVERGVDVHLTPGNHDSYIRQHARATAEILARCLDEARTGR